MSDEIANTDITETANGEAPPEPRWLFYVLSAIIPIAGVIIGVIFTTKPGEDNKKFGKVCLYTAVGVIAVIIMLYIAFIALYVAIIIIYFIIVVIIIVLYIVFMIALVGMGILGGTAGYMFLPYFPEISGFAANAANYLW